MGFCKRDGNKGSLSEFVMKDIPERIALHLGEISDTEFDEASFNELSEVTWYDCENGNISAHDLQYINRVKVEELLEHVKDYYRVREVMLLSDEKHVNWESVKQQASIAAMQSILQQGKLRNYDLIADSAVECAEALVKRLRESMKR